MKHFFIHIVVLPTVSVLLSCMCLRAQPTTTATAMLTDSSLRSGQNAFGFSGLSAYDTEQAAWRFCAGDDKRWATLTFPDSAWMQTSPSAITHEAAGVGWMPARTNIGWFRLHFSLDSTLHQRSFAFVMSLVGAAEVYVDGRLVAQHGVPSATAETELLPLSGRYMLHVTMLNLDASQAHVLAVRYSFAHYEIFRKRYQGWLHTPQAGLRTAFMSRSAVEQYRSTALQTVIQFGICIGMPLLAGILHLVLFVFYRREAASIFVAAYSLVSASLAYCFAVAAHVMGQSFESAAMAELGVLLSSGLIALTLWYAAHSLFRPHLPSYHWLIFASNILVLLIFAFSGYLPQTYWTLSESVAVAIAFVPLLLTLPVVIGAAKRGVEGSFIFGIGMVTCIGAWVLEISLSAMGLRYASRPLALAVFIRFGVYIAIPLALSVLLARRTARQAFRLSVQNEILEDNVAKRTQALYDANIALQTQNELLENLNTEKNEMVSIVSHDLKNPIGAVRGLAELIQADFVDAEQTILIANQIIFTSDRMLELVKNLLDIHRLESGATEFQRHEFRVAPIIESLLVQYHAAASAKHITFHFRNDAAARAVVADEQAVVQVLDNLVSNAVKYSPHGKPVFVRMRNDETTVRVEVQDEGEGISADDMKMLFGKFARLSARPTGGEHSTGLGLSIVKKMVEAMNGTVWCESEAGKGSTFIVKLPSAASVGGA